MLLSYESGSAVMGVERAPVSQGGTMDGGVIVLQTTGGSKAGEFSVVHRAEEGALGSVQQQRIGFGCCLCAVFEEGLFEKGKWFRFSRRGALSEVLASLACSLVTWDCCR